VKNLSRHKFSLHVFKLLGKGLNFCPRPPHYDKNILQNDLKAFFRRIELKAHFGISAYEPTILQQLKDNNKLFKPNNIDPTIQTFQLAVKTDLENYEQPHPPRDNLTKQQRKVLAELKNRTDLVITRADKGGATVIWGIEEYLAEANSQLNNSEFYQELSTDPFNDYQQIIINSLNEMLSESMITKETAEVLKPKNVKPARFYLLPKIHKKNIPGRPVISSINCHTTKLSRYVDYHIKPLATKVKSYIRDTTDFINKLQNIRCVPHNAILATLDVKSLYSNIKHNEGLLALEECLDNRTHKEPSSKVITTLMNHILTLNNFNFNGRNFLQIKGCAMGTIAAPSYATIYMGKFETQFIYPEIDSDCLFYARYIDDIFLIYTGGDTKLKQFLKDLNTKHDSIKFDYETSTKSIAFLDTLIYIDEKRHLQTTLYTKPTDTHNYLHSKSSHPRHLKDSLPYSQALRLNRICSQKNELDLQCEKLKQQFVKRGYNLKEVHDQINKAVTLKREDTLKLTKHDKNNTNRIPFITTFNSTLPPITDIIHKHWDILKLKPNLEDIFTNPGMLTFRRSKNIKDMIGSNNILNDRIVKTKPRTKTIQPCQPCNHSSSLCCKYLNSTETFTSNVTNKTYNIYHKTNCKSKNVIYLLECTLCSMQYVGKSEWPFNLRLNNYKYRIKSIAPDKLLPVEQHFRSTNHDFAVHAKFTIIEQIEKNTLDNVTLILETHEDNWILRLKTLHPNGLNNKLNHPDKH